MLFRKIILKEIHIRTSDPTNNQQLVAFFGLDFVNTYKVKINNLTGGKNSQLFYNIYFYFLEKLFKRKENLSDAYKNSFAKRYFEKLEMVHDLYVQDNKLFIGKKSHEQFDDFGDYFTYLDSSMMGTFSRIKYNTKNEISKSGFENNFYGSRKYQDWELITFQLMSKQPILFPKINNINTDNISVEAVDVNGFKKDMVDAAFFVHSLDLGFSLDDIVGHIDISTTDYGFLKNCFKQLSDNFDDEAEYNKEKDMFSSFLD
jgi:hypothetical protein